MRLNLQHLATPSAISWGITVLVRLWFSTVRVEVLNRERFERITQDPTTGNFVGGVWHRNAIFLFFFFRTLGPRGLMISRSKDGEVIARIARRFGYTTMRGSSSKGGSSALKQMIQYMKATHEKRLCGTPLDGPRGPARIMKKGMLVLAKATGAKFCPIACSGTRVLTFHKAWDKTMIPLPFSKMVIDFGETFTIAPNADDAELENLRRRIEHVLNEMTDNLDRICGYAQPGERGKSATMGQGPV
jgi:lysophospholipid acyltransferase (LPLAT)-like uncharacterized protein